MPAATPDTAGLLKMRDLAERSGVSAGTIKHYLREGVLGDDAGIVRTSRNMAWYPPDFVERIRLVKRLQEERFMPLRVIKGVMDRGPEQAAALVEVEDRILERALAAQPGERLSKAQARERYGVPQNVLDRLAEIAVLTPDRRGYDRDDVQIIEAISRFRASRLRRGARLHGVRHAALPRGAAAARRGRGAHAAGPARRRGAASSARRTSSPPAPSRCASCIGAMHAKLLLAELRRQRGASDRSPGDSPASARHRAAALAGGRRAATMRCMTSVTAEPPTTEQPPATPRRRAATPDAPLVRRGSSGS